MDFNLLKELSEVNGISGHEYKVRKIMERELEQVVDEISCDNLGSFISIKNGNGPNIMLAAHMDEVGFVVKYIDENGFIFFETVGGWWSQVMLAQEVVITTFDNKEYIGVIGSKPPHILPIEKRKEPAKIEDMFIDIGVNSYSEVEELGIRPGDMITPNSICRKMIKDNLIMGKAMDNRIGCYMIIDIMKRIKDKDLSCNVYGVATVQEEIGLRGAKTAANLIKPDISIAIDTGIAGDTPMITKKEALSRLGEGPQIIIMDATTLGHPGLRNYIVDIANKYDIKVQFDTTIRGGTDAGSMHLAHSGSPAMSISVATRYIHSHLSIVDMEDVEGLIDLLVKFVSEINSIDLEKIKGYDER